MDRIDRIEIGDIVSVNFFGAQTTLSHRAEVLFMPGATGDFWGFRDLDNGLLHYTSEGCTITKDCKEQTAIPEDEIPF